MSTELLVSTDWLAANLGAPGVKVLDCSWYLPTEKRDPHAEHRQAHIPGAVYFDIDRIADASIPLPHMWPSAETFETEVSALGVGNGDHVICYDGGMATAACRAWWMFRGFGHDRVSVLNGGFKRWQAEGRPVEAGVNSPARTTFKATPRPLMVRLREHVMELVGGNGATQILDARSRGRFTGQEPEPRPGMRSGHMPGALNLPYTELLDSDGRFRSADEIAEAFKAAGVDLARPVVTSCGSGVSATVLLMGLHLAGHQTGTLYDGSWSEWGSRQDTPVVTGP
jgi:thiosulfate/3-mercaptopyruvate sulfurtransferase